jgi:hypothetical protein
VEKSIFTALTVGGSADQIGHEFGVPDLGWRIRRLQLAHFYGWTLASIDALSLNDLSDALAYRAAILKSRSAFSADRA